MKQILILCLVVLTSCSRQTVQVLSGNISYSGGQYQKAILSYFKAESHPAGQDVVLYNLANVYYALGEGDAALSTWQLAEQNTESTDILFRAAFNRGVLYYQRGRFEEAYYSFRRALTLRPADVDAKINLEHSLSRIRSAAPGNVPERSGGEHRTDIQNLLDYVRRKEAAQWPEQAADSGESVRDW